MRAGPRVTVPDFASYTLGRYNRTVDRVASLRWKYVAIVLAAAAVGWLLYPPSLSRYASGPMALRLLTVAWLLPVPTLLVAFFGFAVWFRPWKLRIDPPLGAVPGPRPVVHFQITTTGVNAGTVRHTAESVLHWTWAHPELPYRSEVWVFVEEWGWLPNRAVFDGLGALGVRVVVVPADYRPPGGSLRKSRALQYSVGHRRALGLDPASTWVYHQDDETAVGEDTVLGVAEFLIRHGSERAVGMGMIIYPQRGGDFRPSFVADFLRAKDDFRNMLTISGRRNVFGGFHGSHYIVREDVEEAVGYDVGRDLIVSEDFYFEVRVRHRFGGIFHVLRGFAYEQSPLTLSDQLKQRRRWVWNLRSGWLHLDLPASRRAMLAYSLTTWMCASLSTGLIVASLVLHFGPIIPLGGLLAGVVWSIMVLQYYVGYSLHRDYVSRFNSLPRLVANGIVGALTDAVAVWAGMLTRQRGRFEVVRKDA